MVTYDPTTQKVTLTGTVAAYYQGTLVSVLTSGWLSSAHPNVTGHQYFLYYDGANFVWGDNVSWTFDMLQICYVQYGATNKFAIRECHGFMPWQAHEEFHRTLGTYRISGGTISGIVIGSTTASERRPAVADTTVADEDLKTVIPSKTASLYTQMTLSGAGTASTFALNAAEMLPVVGNVAYYNQFTTTWVQTALGGNDYGSVWLVAMPVTAESGSQAYRYIWIQGQAVSNSLTTAQAWQFSDLSLGDLRTLSPEFVPLAKVIIRASAPGTNWSVVSVTDLSTTRSTSSSPSGFLAAVAVTTTLSGDGTAASPLAVVSAPILTTARTINGVSFNGSANVAGREVLAAPRTIYVRSDGNDSNTGLVDSAGGALLTLQAAVNLVCSTLDMGNNQVTIDVGNGTYAAVNLLPYVGNLPVIILGDVTTPSNVLVTSATTIPINLSATYCASFTVWTLQGLKLTTTGTGGSCISVNFPSRVNIDRCEFGACVSRHQDAQNGGQIFQIGAYTISGGATCHMFATAMSVIRNIGAFTVTLTGTPAFSSAFSNATYNSTISIRSGSVAYSGSATGLRYTVDYASAIFTNAGGATFFPGNSNGTPGANGGYYQ